VLIGTGGSHALETQEKGEVQKKNLENAFSDVSFSFIGFEG
jgi:hypothetical protein